MVKRLLGSAPLLALALIGAACTTSGATDTTSLSTVPESRSTSGQLVEGLAIEPFESASLRNQFGYEFPAAPAVPDGPPDPILVEHLDVLFGGLEAGLGVNIDSIAGIEASGDARAAWSLSDLLRVLGPSVERNRAIEAVANLTGTNLYDDPVTSRSLVQSMVDHLIAWDIQAMDGYEKWKKQLLLLIEPAWGPLFADTEADFDWRVLNWGGVLIDDRPLGTPVGCPRGCIPALDDPEVTDAVGGSWYPDDALVFGITVNGESRAYPKNIMEVHEMVNDTLGGRRLGIPYCTLCGSAQAYLTDSVSGDIETPVLRTSGLLTRSNKVMYDLVSSSMFDTFTGRAVSGPLRAAELELEQVSIVTSRWVDWRIAHPDTTIVSEDGGVGRAYDLDPLGGRDDNGPIFPIGDVDERLGTQELVLGAFSADGTPIAFPVAQARAVIDGGGAVRLMGIRLVPDGSGVRAVAEDGADVVGHEAFWFAWSQFHPETVVWSPAG
jgi:Protein of unknown function (DUF3179)